VKGEATGGSQPPLPSERISDLVFGIATVWVANRYAGGIARLRGSATDLYGLDVFGNLANMGIEDIQFAGSGSTRKALVGFRANASTAGFVAVYSGN